MDTADRFDQFLDNISIEQRHLDDAATKYRGVVAKLQSHYYSASYTGSTSLLIGSYGKGTQVYPPRDVDILFLMPYEQFQRYNAYAGNGQSQLLQDVKSVLKTKYTTTEKIRGDGQVVVVPFQNGHTVELLPAWKLTNGKYFVPDTHDGGSWKTVDHAAEISNVNDSDRRSDGNTRSLIKMMKVWQDYCSVPITSLTLELRAVNFLRKWKHYKESTMYYDWMVRDYLEDLLRCKNFTCTIPGTDEKYSYGEAWVSKAESAYGRAVNACEYESTNRHNGAAIEWQKIFGARYDY